VNKIKFRNKEYNELYFEICQQENKMIEVYIFGERILTAKNIDDQWFAIIARLIDLTQTKNLWDKCELTIAGVGKTRSGTLVQFKINDLVQHGTNALG